LKKAIYGLKQSARVWYEKVEEALLDLGFTKSAHEPCVFFKHSGDRIIIVALYVGDFFLFSDCPALVASLKSELAEGFKTNKDLGEISEFLGITVTRHQDGYSLSQAHYAEDILRRFGMSDCNSVLTPLESMVTPNHSTSNDEDAREYQELVGCLMYLAVCTRYDLAYAASQLSQNNAHPTAESWSSA